MSPALKAVAAELEKLAQTVDPALVLRLAQDLVRGDARAAERGARVIAETALAKTAIKEGRKRLGRR